MYYVPDYTACLYNMVIVFTTNRDGVNNKPNSVHAVQSGTQYIEFVVNTMTRL